MKGSGEQAGPALVNLVADAAAHVQAAQGRQLEAGRRRWLKGKWLSISGSVDVFLPRERAQGAPTGKQGRHKQSVQFNLLSRLRQYAADVWRFASDVGVPFTNNLAEQALRMSKERQKVSGCFRTNEGAKTFFVIRSYLQTMRKQRVSLF